MSTDTVRAAKAEKADASSPAASRSRVSVSRWSGPGLWLAGLFLSLSLFPSLRPRPGWGQGIVCGVTLIVGYGIGTGAAAPLRKLGIPAASGRTATTITWLSRGLVMVAVCSSVWRHVG